MESPIKNLAKKRRHQAKLVETVGQRIWENILRLRKMSDDDIKYLESKSPDEIVYIEEYFGVSLDNFSRVVNEANRKTGEFERHRFLHDDCHIYGSAHRGLQFAFLFRKLNSKEYQKLEELVPKMKKLDSECFTSRKPLPNGYVRVYADTSAGPNQF